MVLRFNRATPADLHRWASMLRKVAEEMQTVVERANRPRSPIELYLYEKGRKGFAFGNDPLNCFGASASVGLAARGRCPGGKSLMLS
jgi:hypothetical protein